MSKRVCALLIAVIFSAFILFGCNDSGNIWERYCSESFCVLVRYESEEATVCTKIKVIRSEDADKVIAEFSSPDALRGAIGIRDGGQTTLVCDDIELNGDFAEELMKIPLALAATEAQSFSVERSDGGSKLIVAKTEGGTLIFDASSGALVGASLGSTDCEVITFSFIK